jgi:hypothetical protein
VKWREVCWRSGRVAWGGGGEEEVDPRNIFPWAQYKSDNFLGKVAVTQLDKKLPASKEPTDSLWRSQKPLWLFSWPSRITLVPRRKLSLPFGVSDQNLVCMSKSLLRGCFVSHPHHRRFFLLPSTGSFQNISNAYDLRSSQRRLWKMFWGTKQCNPLKLHRRFGGDVFLGNVGTPFTDYTRQNSSFQTYSSYVLPSNAVDRSLV